MGSHVCLFYLRLLLLDFPLLVPLVLGRLPRFHSPEDGMVRFPAPLCRGHRRYCWRVVDRHLAGQDRQCQIRASVRGDHRHVGMYGFHPPICAHHEFLYCGVLPDRGDVLPRVHYRSSLGSVDGCRRGLLRNRVRDDEHGGEHRGRALPYRPWSPGRPWLLGGAFHCCRVPALHRRGHLGILA